MSNQYRSAIFFHGEEQRRVACESMKREEDRRGRRLFTTIEPATPFTRAEDYHQKYLLQRESEIFDAYQRIYPDPVAFTDSTAVARVNGYLGGFGTLSSLERDLPLLGLPAGAGRILRRRIERSAAEERWA